MDATIWSLAEFIKTILLRGKTRQPRGLQLAVKRILKAGHRQHAGGVHRHEPLQLVFLPTELVPPVNQS